MTNKSPSRRTEGNRKTKRNKPSRSLSSKQLLTKLADCAPVAIHKFRIGPDGKFQIPYASPAIIDIYGLPPEEIRTKFNQAIKKIHRNDLRQIFSKLKASKRRLKPFHCEWRVMHPTKGEIWVSCHSTPEIEADGGIAWYGYFRDITELKRAEQERISHLNFFETMERVNRIIQGAEYLDQMLGDLLDSLLSVFDCDRAWLLYPCDPDAESWRVPMERTRPEYSGAFAADRDFPTTPEVAETMKLILDARAPVTFGPGGQYPLPEKVSRENKVRSFLAKAIHPKDGKPWIFGLHQCGYSRIWSTEDIRLFSAIGRRLSDRLGSLLVSRELQESEERFRQAFELAATGMALVSTEGNWLRGNLAICEMLGYSEAELLSTSYEELTHPDDLILEQRELQRLIRGEVCCLKIEKRYRRRDSGFLWTRQTTSIVRPSSKKASYFVLHIENIDQLRRDEERLALMSFAINHIDESVFLITEDSRFEYVNDKAFQALGYERDELLALGVPEVDPNYSGTRWNSHWQELKSKGSILFESTHRHKNGTSYPVEISTNYFEYNGRSYNLALAHNITERKKAEENLKRTAAALRESEERFRQMAESIQEVFWLTDIHRKQMLYISPAYEKIWGRSRHELYTKPMQWVEATHPDDRQRVLDAIDKNRSTGEYRIEYRIIRPDGSIRHIYDRAFPIRDGSGKLYRIAGVAQDVTARKEQDQRIQYLAFHDALTGLPNRTLVMNRLEMAVAQSERYQRMVAVLFLDLDRFKNINDTLGHPAGDTLLQQVGKRLGRLLREEDTVGRVGGDEFLIVIPDLNSPEDAAHVTTKIIQSLTGRFEVAGNELHVNASVGISLYPRDAKQPEFLIKYADSALYLAKEQGRNTYRFFSPELDAKVRERLHLENDLRLAIERNELHLRFQPQIDQASGQFTGAEALIRWHHPLRGWIPPAEFIPIAEETGLIIPIGEWVLRTASAQAHEWNTKKHFDLRVSVNLSRRQIERMDFTERVRQILEETGCEPQLLELELTESSAMNRPEEAIVTLKILHEMGIQLALDDFGTGYSSLAYLKRFPFDRLKIDQSFVSGIPEDHDDLAIVQTTIMLARQMRLKVIAEGVETEAQRDFLYENGCSEMQGNLFGIPLPPEDILSLYNSAKRRKGSKQFPPKTPPEPNCR